MIRKELALLITDRSLCIFVVFLGYLHSEDEAVSGTSFHSLAVVGNMFRSETYV